MVGRDGYGEILAVIQDCEMLRVSVDYCLLNDNGLNINMRF